MQWIDSSRKLCVLEVNETGEMSVVNGCLLPAAKEVYPDKKIRFINVSLCAWTCRCVQKPKKFVRTIYIEDKVTWWLRTGNIHVWNYWQRWQYMKLLTALAVYKITDSTGSIWNYWQRWQYMKLLTALAVYEITDSAGSIWNYW